MKTILLGSLIVGSLGFADGVRPNSYTCQGDKTEVNYSSTSLAGKPMMSVVFTGQSVKLPSFPEIQRMTSPIGNLLTVTDNHLVPVDGPSIRYTLVLPRVVLGDRMSEERFKTQVVKTSVVNPFFRPRPFNGVEEINQFVEVECVAQSLVF